MASSPAGPTKPITGFAQIAEAACCSGLRHSELSAGAENPKMRQAAMFLLNILISPIVFGVAAAVILNAATGMSGGPERGVGFGLALHILLTGAVGVFFVSVVLTAALRRLIWMGVGLLANGLLCLALLPYANPVVAVLTTVVLVAVQAVIGLGSLRLSARTG